MTDKTSSKSSKSIAIEEFILQFAPNLIHHLTIRNQLRQ